MDTFTSKTVGRCLTEYILSNYDNVVTQCVSFVVYSQFDNERVSPSRTEKADCFAGQTLCGITLDGREIVLKRVVDSSD